MKILKMCLKQSISKSKWGFQAIMFLTVLSNCVFRSSNFDTTSLSDCAKFLVFFSGYWIRH